MGKILVSKYINTEKPNIELNRVIILMIILIKLNILKIDKFLIL